MCLQHSRASLFKDPEDLHNVYLCAACVRLLLLLLLQVVGVTTGVVRGASTITRSRRGEDTVVAVATGEVL